MLLSQHGRQPPQVLTPIQIAVDQDLLRMPARQLVEVREIVGVRANGRDHLPGDQRNDRCSHALDLPSLHKRHAPTPATIASGG